MDMTAALGFLFAHLPLFLGTLVVPFLVMAVFVLIRKQAGNAVTAMPDVLVFLFSVDLWFLVSPEPWQAIVNPALKDAFRVMSAALGLAAMVVFLLVMGVERQINSHHMQRRWPVAHLGLMPPTLQNAQYPYMRLVLSWMGIAWLAGLNAVAFVLR